MVLAAHAAGIFMPLLRFDIADDEWGLREQQSTTNECAEPGAVAGQAKAPSRDGALIVCRELLGEVGEFPAFEALRSRGYNNAGGATAHDCGEVFAEGHHLVRRADGDAEAIGPRRPDAADVHVSRGKRVLNLLAGLAHIKHEAVAF